ncbi:CynX/NimT family MFS transporter [Streptomyces spiramenti]
MADRYDGDTVRTASRETKPPGDTMTAMSPRMALLVATGLVLAAFNLRPAISGLGPLLEEVRDALAMSPTIAGLLTSAPALCFAVFGALTPRLSRRWGPVAVLLAGMAAITLGVALRPLAGGTGVFLLTSALALAGIAVSNVLMPVIVKRFFPDRVGTMTGLYSTGLALGTSGAAALTVPLADAVGGGWRTGLAIWAVPGALAVLCWIAVVVSGRAAPGGPAAATAPADGPPVRITRSPTAWALAVFFGLQSTGAYVTMGWMPQIYRDAGLSATTAGTLVAVAMGMGVPLAFVLPKLATRFSHQGPLITVLGLCGVVSYIGLMTAPAAGAWAWALLLGIANCAFPVVLTLIGLRARTGTGVSQLSAFVQSTGYLLCIPGPLLVGFLYGSTGGWYAPLMFMTVLAVAQVAVGVVAGRDRVVEDGG